MMPVTLVCLLITVHAAQGYKCFEGQVTYCGINADGGAVAPPGKNYYVEGQNWACTDPGSNMDPTFIAPNCWDQQSCSNLQTDPYDDAFNMSHQQPYDYVGNIGDEDLMRKEVNPLRLSSLYRRVDQHEPLLPC